MFKNTEKFQAAVAVVNDTDSGFLEKKLMQILTTDLEETSLLFSASCYVFEQALYYNIQPSKLLEQLSQSGITSEKAKVYSDAWEEFGAGYQRKKKEEQELGRVLKDFNYQFQITMGQSGLSKQKNVNTVFEFRFGQVNQKHNESEINHINDGDESVHVEFTKDELYSFFGKLEQIQSQLDNLS